MLDSRINTENLDTNSALFWWPKTKSMAIPQPKTEIVPVDRKSILVLMEGHPVEEHELYWKSLVEEVDGAARRLGGYPIFVRTDQASGKHDWKDSCFIASKDDIPRHLSRIFEFNEMAGMPFGLDYRSLMVREFLYLAAPFTAFNGMPVAQERRYFVNGPEVVCHHPYWIESAIADSERSYAPLPEGWREMLAKINAGSPDEFPTLASMASRIGEQLGGEWSIDFALIETGQPYWRPRDWFFIDAAQARSSWHPEHPA